MSHTVLIEIKGLDPKFFNIKKAKATPCRDSFCRTLYQNKTFIPEYFSIRQKRRTEHLPYVCSFSNAKWHFPEPR